jgi:hypothetical protein
VIGGRGPTDSLLERIRGATAALEGHPTLLGERLDARCTTELAIAGVLHAAKGGHRLVANTSTHSRKGRGRGL